MCLVIEKKHADIFGIGTMPKGLAMQSYAITALESSIVRAKGPRCPHLRYRHQSTGG